MGCRYLNIILLFCFTWGPAPAQNLVPNPSFELYNNCPNNLVSMPFSADYTNFPTITDWTNPCRLSSPDYLNACAVNTSGMKVPYSTFGFQQPTSGNAYTGIIAFQGQYVNGSLVHDYREYLQTRLVQPLEAGKMYCVTFYVSPTISSVFNFNYVAVDEIGIDFTVDRDLDTSHYSMIRQYDVRNTPGVYLSDTSKWYRVNGTYTATGGEQWLTLGTFNTTNSAPPFVNVTPSAPNSNLLYWNYVYIDDVSVREITSADTVYASHDTVVCVPTGLTLPLSGVTGSTRYEWSNGLTADQIFVADTGTYWCRSVQECGLVVDTFHIRYQPYKQLSLGKDTANCQSQPVTIAPNHSYTTYTWSTGASNDSIIVIQSGTYILTVSDICGIQRDTIEVAIQSPTPPPVVSDTIICQTTQAPQLEVSGTGIRWYPANGPIGVAQQPFISTDNYGVQTLYLTQTIGKCESVRVPVDVTIKYKPKADIGDYMWICRSSDTLIGETYPDVDYLWNTNEMVCCIKPRETGTYQLTISNSCGMSSDTAFVELSPCDECLFMPTAFTPNRDGRNDEYRPIVKCPVASFNMQIFNRWGEVVFRSEDPSAAWDGALNGNLCDAGAFVYLVEYRSSSTGTVRSLKGNITLIR